MHDHILSPTLTPHCSDKEKGHHSQRTPDVAEKPGFSGECRCCQSFSRSRQEFSGVCSRGQSLCLGKGSNALYSHPFQDRFQTLFLSPPVPQPTLPRSARAPAASMASGRIQGRGPIQGSHSEQTAWPEWS